MKKALHQVIDNVLSGDAVSDHALLMRDWLRELGFDSNVYVVSSGAGLEHEVRQFTPGMFSPDDLVVYHHSIGSKTIDHLIDRGVSLILIYQNITPPDFFQLNNPAMARQMIEGREQLLRMRPNVVLALGASAYSQDELIEAGFENTGVLPLVFKEEAYHVLDEKNQLRSENIDGPSLLFVGRVAPNKRHEDLVKLLYFLRRISPKARLMFVGSRREKNYANWLNQFIKQYGLTDAVTFIGHVNLDEIAGFYRSADLFVSMSEHEGFCKPLIESMYFELPIMAYSSTAVPSTLGGAGVLFNDKDFEALAEMADILIRDQRIRRRIIARQSERLQDFLAPNVRMQWQKHLKEIHLLQQDA
jgi:L-malate glycosyltransferase